MCGQLRATDITLSSTPTHYRKSYEQKASIMCIYPGLVVYVDLNQTPNMGWRNASFRGFADYMQTQEFEKNLTTLINLAERRQVSLMCAEAAPWRCHRFLIADALCIRGIQVKHILGLTVSIPHSVPTWADVKGTSITYTQRDSNGAPNTRQLRLDPQASDERQDI